MFLNKNGLKNTPGRSGFGRAKTRLYEKQLRPNQSYILRFISTALYRCFFESPALPEDEIRLPQGCHDHGYLATLLAQTTTGFVSRGWLAA